MSNLMALSLNSIDNSSDSGTNKEKLIQNGTESTTTKKNYTFKEKFISTLITIIGICLLIAIIAKMLF
jgi:hypothetical protein